MPLNSRPKWILATAAAIAATSVGGLALAQGGGTDSGLPGSINLRDQVPVATQTMEATSQALFDVREGPVVRAQDGSFTVLSANSADTSHSADAVGSAGSNVGDDTLDTSNTPDHLDSPNDSVNTLDTANTLDTVDTAPTPDAVDTAASVDTVDSIHTTDTADTANTFD